MNEQRDVTVGLAETEASDGHQGVNEDTAQEDRTTMEARVGTDAGCPGSAATAPDDKAALLDGVRRCFAAAERRAKTPDDKSELQMMTARVLQCLTGEEAPPIDESKFLHRHEMLELCKVLEVLEERRCGETGLCDPTDAGKWGTALAGVAWFDDRRLRITLRIACSEIYGHWCREVYESWWLRRRDLANDRMTPEQKVATMTYGGVFSVCEFEHLPVPQGMREKPLVVGENWWGNPDDHDRWMIHRDDENGDGRP